MLIEFMPDPQLAETVQRAMMCAPVACDRDVHCGRMALALRDCFRQAHAQDWNGAPLPSVPPPASWPASFAIGDYVRKVGRGGCWRGKVVGWYRSSDTQEGYVVESAFERGSTHIYPASALEPWNPEQTA